MKRNSETPQCLVCNSNKRSSFLTVPNRFNLEESFQLVQCEECNFVYLSPRPNEKEIAAYYEDEEYQPHQQDAPSLADKVYRWIRVWNNKYKRKIIEKLVLPGSILDYGCGTGEFLKEMKTSGWETYGFEPSDKARQVAKTYNVELIDDIGQLEQTVNIITLWHVLEHIHQPVQLLEALKKRLETSGFLLIAVPNCRSFDARLFRENWVAYDAPRHLYHFRSTDIEEFLSQQGFEIVDYRRLNFDPWFNSLFSAVLQSRENKFWLISLGLLKSTFSAVISSLMGWININNHASIIYIAKPVSK